jgi:hypothetical protein
MPLTSFHCPGMTFLKMRLSDCERCPDQCLPIEVVRVVWDANLSNPGHYHNDQKCISVTDTLSCLRKVYYAATTDYSEEPASMLARTTGTIIHSELEGAQDDGENELELRCDIDGVYELRGTVDRVIGDTIIDYKTVDRVRKTYDENNAKQLNIYAQMLGRPGMKKLIYQIARKGVSVHEVHDIPDALDVALDRAGALISAYEGAGVDSLPKEGKDMKFFKSCACDYCPFADECQPVDVEETA